MAAKVQAVLFDYGMVLTGPPLPEVWHGMQQVTGAEEAPFSEAYWRHRLEYDRGSLTGPNYWRAVGADLGWGLSQNLTEQQVAELIALDTRLWTQVNQPMVDWALRLRDAGTATGILSNLGDSMMDGVRRELGWMSGFDHMTFSHSLRLVKPDERIYRHAAEGLKLPAENILFVDDRKENVEGAERAGLQAIQYTDHDAFVLEMHVRRWMRLWQEGRP